MWIRSQGKHTLIETNLLQVFDDKRTNIWGIKAINVQCERILGRYSTEEKAIKVLDMLTQCVSGFTDEETDEFYQYGVFQMPQDDEVE